MKKQKIGFIGQGWIGKHYADNFVERGYKVVRYDLSSYKKNKRYLKDCEIVFIAVPTPSTPEKGFDDSILISAIKDATVKGQTIVIKSTIQVGTTEKIQKLFKDRFIIHSPEFLTEKTAKYDAACPARNILGYSSKSKSKCGRVMNVLPVAPYEAIVPAKEAEIVKYAGNIWFYMKVMTMNLIYDVVENEGLDYELVKDMLGADKRVGRTHLDIFHQGGRGAGGHCFIKDMKAFEDMYDKIDENNVLGGYKILRNVQNYNIALLGNSNKSMDLLEGVYGKEKVEFILGLYNAKKKRKK